MYGVVLWSDEQEQKAVIWCEDHGDLAFYRNTDGTNPCDLDAGDWVCFDLTMESSQRFAHNPRLIHEGVYPELADALSAASPKSAAAAQPRGQNEIASPERGPAQVIPIAAHRASWSRATGSARENRA